MARVGGMYPHVDDPDHPLFSECAKGWPNFNPPEAWREMVKHAGPRQRADSAQHPAFSAGYIKNDFATRPEEPRQVDPLPEPERR